jgi:predicted nuclease with TOPRIM domain
MASVERIGNASVNFRENDNKTQDVKTTNLKKSVTPTNVALGSLATLGVLGMADILIYKGKHINKLTGKGKELEEALSRATSAETKVAEAETKITGLETKVQEITENSATSIDKLKKKVDDLTKELAKTKDIADLYKLNRDNLLKRVQSLYYDVEAFGEETTAHIRKKFSITLRTMGLEIVDTPSKALKEGFSVETAAAIDSIDVTAPAIVEAGTNRVVLKGHVFVPENYKF